MKLKRAEALAFIIDRGSLIGINFLEKSYFDLNPEFLGLLLDLADWRDLDDLRRDHGQALGDTLLPILRRLAEMNALIVEGSIEELRDRRYAETWEWGAVAGLHHFLSKDLNYLTEEEGHHWLRGRAEQKPQPDQFEINADGAVALPYPRMEGELFETMLRRRSERKFLDRTIDAQALSDILFCGFGITAMVDDDQLGWLPLTMTPSGGARNPYEGYVAVRNVEGINPGFYHYDGASKNLMPVSEDLPSRAAMLGDQAWADDAGFVVFLVARFERTMWKYPNPAAYRVVLIEAGHIVQNMMLASVRHDLVTAPTCAVSDSTMAGILSPHDAGTAALYSLSVGHPGKGFDTIF